jgi:hypothetical protein
LPERVVAFLFYSHDTMWGKCEGVEGFVFYMNAESEVCRVQIPGLWVSTSQLLNTQLFQLHYKRC